MKEPKSERIPRCTTHDCILVTDVLDDDSLDQYCPICRADQAADRTYATKEECFDDVFGEGLSTQAAESPRTDLEIANGAYLQYVDTGDGCYIDNLTPDEMRAFLRDLGDTDRANNAGRPGRGDLIRAKAEEYMDEQRQLRERNRQEHR